jgi:hypothetical protein
MKENQSVAIMQPFFFPYLGYFSLMKHTDNWIVFDDIRYSNQAWGNRNRILKHPEGWAWINVPVKDHKRETFYSNILIQNEINWKRKIINQFEYYKIHAPFYKDVLKIIQEVFSEDFSHLVDLNIHAMKKVCEYLKIDFKYTKFSEMNLGINSVQHPGQWALEICKAIKSTNYVNPCEGHPIYDKKEYDDAGISLQFIINRVSPYDQKRAEFEARLSIIDVMMWNSVERVNELIDDFYKCQGECLLCSTDKTECEFEKFGVKRTNKSETDPVKKIVTDF